MSTPDKTSETLDLAKAMNDNPSASGSSDDNAVSKAKSLDDQQNANVSDIEKQLSEISKIDMAYRNSVITKDSSSDFIDNAEDHPTSSPDKTEGSGSDAPSLTKDDLATATTVKDEKKDDEAIPNDAEVLEQINNDGNPTDSEPAVGLVNIKPEDDKDWKPDVGSVYNRVLNIQKTEPKKYVPKEFVKVEKHEIENIQVLPEILNCPKCNRKVAAGAINHHVKFCNPDETDTDSEKTKQ